MIRTTLKRKDVSALLFILCAGVIFVSSNAASAAGFGEIESILGVKAEMHDTVCVFRFPRNDINVTVDGDPVPTAIGFGGWTAWKMMGNDAMIMGDLVLLEKEINPVISALAEADINITALHNHFLGESPRIMFMHVDGMGSPTLLARGLQKALSMTGTLKPRPASGSQAQPTPFSLDTKRIEEIIGQQGQAGGGVFKITIGRPGVIMHGEELTATMGLNTWAAFFGTSDRAHVAGDVAMTDKEINPVIRALRRGDIDVVAVHNHMLDEQPHIFFLHYWGTGPAEKLARTLREAFDQAKGPVG